MTPQELAERGIRVKPLPSVETLRCLLRYEADTGNLFWLPRPVSMFQATNAKTSEHQAHWWNGRFAGQRADSADFHQGYRRVCLGRTNYRAHRVVWAMVTGQWPEALIDHINGDKSDNRLANLRAATPSQNSKNRVPHGSSKYRGVSWRSATGLWVAAIKTDGVVTFLGRFRQEEDAARAYDKAAIEQHGRFARLNFPQADHAARIAAQLECSREACEGQGETG